MTYGCIKLSIYFLKNQGCSGTLDNKSSTREEFWRQKDLQRTQRAAQEITGNSMKISENDINTTHQRLRIYIHYILMLK
jgi:hypothetical protein